MCMTDYDPAVVYRQEMRTARKPWQCTECHRTIQPGERYSFVAAMWEPGGRWSSIRTCGHCAEVQRWLLWQCHGFMHDATLDDLYEHWDESDLCRTVTFGRLVVRAGGTRRRIPWRRLDGSLMPVSEVAALVDRVIAGQT